MNIQLDSIIEDLKQEIDEFKDNIENNEDFPYDDSPTEFLRWQEECAYDPMDTMHDIVSALYN